MRRILAFFAVLWAPSFARADVVELTGGTKLEGDVLESGGKGVRILLPAGDEVYLAKADVKSVAVEPNAPGDGRYTRYSRDGAKPGLQVGIVHFEKEGAPRVDLVGVVHVADAAYYAEIQAVLDRADVVLYEMVGDPDEKVDREDPAVKNLDVLRKFQNTLGRALDLTFQKDGIDYRRKHFVHADMSVKEFMAQGGADFGKDLAAKMAALTPFLERFDKVLDRPTDASKAAVRALRALMKPLMASMLGDRGDESSAVLGGADFSELIITRRNEVAAATFDVTARSRPAKSIAIFYGAAHMPDFEKRLVERGWHRAGGRWLTAWDVAKKSAETERLPALAPSGTSPAMN